MVNIAILDDETVIHQSVQSIINSINEYEELQITQKSFLSSEDFLNDTEILKYDILILDIELPGVNGIELAERLRDARANLYIVFLTSYENYMKDAFGLNVYQYMLKQDMNQDLKPAIIKLISILIKKKSKKILVKSEEGEILLNEDEIVCVIYENRHPVFYTMEHRYIVLGKTMLAVYDMLNPLIFTQPVNISQYKFKSTRKVKDDSIVKPTFI